ncbi:MAG: non-canonical purine NTP diphosphatase [Flavobacteriaceae bacterium]
MTLVFASNNKHKIQEIKALLPDSFIIKSLEDIGCTEDIPETADTIEGNAALKADYVTQKYGLPCFADDSGLEVEALNGAPGVHSARYAGEQKNDNDNIEKLLTELQGKTNRKARFKTVIALNSNGKQHLFEGIIEGEIISEKRGTNGFGYDPVFVAENSDKTFAELTSEEKNKVSHRARAVEQLIGLLLEV